MADTIPEVLAEIQSGDGLSLAAAGRLFPGHRDNGHIGPSTVFRWVTKGTRTPDGQTIKLAACRVASRWMTSRAAVARFVMALTAAAEPASAAPVPPPRTDSERRRACDQAIAKLKARGA